MNRSNVPRPALQPRNMNDRYLGAAHMGYIRPSRLLTQQVDK